MRGKYIQFLSVLILTGVLIFTSMPKNQDEVSLPVSTLTKIDTKVYNNIDVDVSQYMSQLEYEKSVRMRTEKLRKYLERFGSPLAPFSEDFVRAGDKYNIDYRILVAVAGKEQTFGVAWPGSSNNFWGYGGCSWSDISTAIWDYTWHMSIDYPNFCQGDVYAASSYAESGSWEADVSEFYNDICSEVER